MNWTHYAHLFDNLEQLDFTKGYTEGCPAFYRFEFQAKELGDRAAEATLSAGTALEKRVK
jgi:hypothetical protein